MKPLQQNIQIGGQKTDTMDKGKKFKIQDNKTQANKAKPSDKLVSNQDFMNFIDSVQSKYYQPMNVNQKKGNLKQKNNKDDIQNKGIDKDNKKNTGAIYSQIEEDYEEDFESDYIDNNIISHSEKRPTQEVQQNEQPNKTYSSKDYLKSQDQKIDKISTKNIENINDHEYKGFYSNYKKFNDNPDLYFQYKAKENNQQIQKKSFSNDKKVKNNQNKVNNLQYQKYSQLTANIQQGIKIPQLPLTSQKIQQKQQSLLSQQQFNKHQEQKEEQDIQSTQSIPNSFRNKYKNSTGYDQFNAFPLESSPIISNKQTNNNELESQQIDNYIIQSQNNQSNYRIRKPHSATIRQKAKQNFFKNIQIHLNKREDSPQKVKNSNLLINDRFDISERNLESEKAMENVLYVEIQNCKVQRNQYIKENHDLQEKIVNIERDIKQMSKQLQKWSIESRMVFDEDEEPYLDAYCCDKVYDDQNFYLITLRQRVNNMKNEISELDESIKAYNQTLRTIRTDTNADQVKTQMEKQFMFDYQIYREMLEENNNENQIQKQFYYKYQHEQNEIKETLRLRDSYEEQIRKVKDDNKVILVEIQLQQEMQEEYDIEISKLDKISKERQSKTEKIKEELKQKSPEDLQMKKNILKQKTIKMEEEKKTRNAEQQQSLIHIQHEKINILKFDFQEFRRKQILENQESVKFNTELKTLIDKLKEDYVKIQSQIIKKKKLIKKQLTQNIDPKLKVEFQQGQQNMFFQEDYQIIDDYEEDFDDQQSNKNVQSLQSVKKTSSINSAINSKKPSQMSLKGEDNINSLQKLQNIQSFQNPQSLPQSIYQSLCSTDKGNYGESQKSQYNNDEPLSMIYGVQTIEV